MASIEQRLTKLEASAGKVAIIAHRKAVRDKRADEMV